MKYLVTIFSIYSGIHVIQSNLLNRVSNYALLPNVTLTWVAPLFFYFCSLLNAAFSKPSSILWCPGRPHQLWQQVFLAEILAWDTPASVSIPCIHISAPNISYPVVIQGLPQFSHTNDGKICQIRPEPISSTFFHVIIHQFAEHSVLYCVQLSKP